MILSRLVKFYIVFVIVLSIVVLALNVILSKEAPTKITDSSNVVAVFNDAIANKQTEFESSTQYAERTSSQKVMIPYREWSSYDSDTETLSFKLPFSKSNEYSCPTLFLTEIIKESWTILILNKINRYSLFVKNVNSHLYNELLMRKEITISRDELKEYAENIAWVIEFNPKVKFDSTPLESRKGYYGDFIQEVVFNTYSLPASVSAIKLVNLKTNKVYWNQIIPPQKQ